MRRCVVAGGSGAVGRLFVAHLRDAGAQVRIVDPAPAPDDGRRCAPTDRLPGDITHPDGTLVAELGRADLVLLAVPEQVAVAAVPGLAKAMRPDALLVDTLSVKQPMAWAVRDAAPNLQAVGLNPMFAPSLGFPGRPVAAVVLHDGPQVAPLLRTVEDWGARLVRLDPAGHDRLAAASQALTHAAVLAFGTALTGLGVPAAELREVAPPPHGTLLALLARIVSGAPEVYRDVQSANPQAAAARTALAGGLRRVAEAVESGREADFAELLSGVRDFLGDETEHYADACHRLFTVL